MFYVIETAEWSNGSGWSYSQVTETGEVESMDMMDVRGAIIDNFNSGYRPQDGKDVCYTCKLYTSEDAYRNHEESVEREDTWESDVWADYNAEN